MGLISGLVFHRLLSADLRDGFVAVFDTVTHMFLNLIKMIIAPLIFATAVIGRRHDPATPDATGPPAKDAKQTRTPAPAMH